MTKEICFDMDGTIADFYSVDGWLDNLIQKDTRPYEIAKPLVNMNTLAKLLNRLQKSGYTLKIISWSSKAKDPAFDIQVREVKEKWLKKHLSSVTFDAINVLPYGTPKEDYGDGILFDDEKPNRDNWNGIAYDESDVIGVLKGLLAS